MRLFFVCLLFLLGGCATTTSVVLLDPTQKYTPTPSVQILLKAPPRPYVEIAKLESKGLAGEPEPSVLEDAREQARKLGAHALLVLETSSIYQPPIIIHEPWPPYLPWYHDRWHGYRYWFNPMPFPYATERVLPGGHVYTVRSVAIRYTD